MCKKEIWAHFASAALNGYLSAPVTDEAIDTCARLARNNPAMVAEWAAGNADYLLKEFEKRFMGGQ